MLAGAAPPGAEVVAIDPHAGNDRGPRQWEGTAGEGEADHAAFRANLERAGVAERVRHVRRPSQEALDAVAGDVDLLYVDGAHRFAAAAADLRRWGARRGARRHAADPRRLLVGRRHAGDRPPPAGGRPLPLRRPQRVARRVPARGPRAGAHGSRAPRRQLASLPWFARNLVVKAAIVARMPWLARALGHRSGPWPY